MSALQEELAEVLSRLGLTPEAIGERVRLEVRRALSEQANEKLVSLAGLAELLGCSVVAAKARTHRDAELSGMALRVGRHRRWRRSEVLALLEARKK